MVGRAVDLIHVVGQHETARDYLFDRIVLVDTLKDATALWEQQPCSTFDGPILVTRAGEVLDAAGVITGGQASATIAVSIACCRKRSTSGLSIWNTSLPSNMAAVRRVTELNDRFIE